MLRRTKILLAATAVAAAIAVPALAHGPQGGWGNHPMMGGQGMMGQGYGMMGGGYGMTGQNCPMYGQQAAANVTPDTVRENLESHLQMMGNDRLKVGPVTQQDDGTIVAEIVTAKEGALVEKFAINPETGQRGHID